jgi:hypothetical protein
MPISHVLIKVVQADYEPVVAFYTRILKPLGLQKLTGFPPHMTAFGIGGPQFVVASGEGQKESNVHVAFGAAGTYIYIACDRFFFHCACFVPDESGETRLIN